MLNRLFLLIIIISVFLQGTLLAAEYVPGEILVGFEGSFSEFSLTSVENADNIKLLGEKGISQTAVIKISDTETVESSVAKFQSMGNVRFAEPNYVFHLLTSCGTSAVPSEYSTISDLIDTQYYLNSINAPCAWAINKGDSSIIVAVVDSAVDTDHPDLSGKLRLDLAYDFIDNDTDVSAAGDDGHATKISGIIAAQTDNAVGIAGVGWKTSILPIRVARDTVNGGGATASAVTSGILHAVSSGADVISLSLGSDQTSESVRSAVESALNKDIVVVAAAGNSGGEVVFPANMDDVISVGSIDASDVHSYFSNVGSKLDIVAPGEDIYTTTSSGVYSSGNRGTSFSTPIISGAAALMINQDPTRKPYEIRNILLLSATDLGPAGKDDLYGFGKLDIYNALLWLTDSTNDVIEAINFPNPFNPNKYPVLIFESTLLATSQTEIKIFDLKGRELRKITSEDINTERHQAYWKGDLESGDRASPGIYPYIIKNSFGIARGNIVVVK